MMIIQTLFAAVLIDDAKSDPVQIANAKIKIAQRAKSFGLDIDRMKLTAQGFEFTR
jgi:hypothetical protein